MKSFKLNPYSEPDDYYNLINKLTNKNLKKEEISKEKYNKKLENIINNMNKDFLNNKNKLKNIKNYQNNFNFKSYFFISFIIIIIMFIFYKYK